ncbi:MAG TPA: hemolysin family protein [Sphingobacteriaceae bacterium]|nr:hemolysin family protein [Sphingobacteriaceae bacterium]
MGWDLFWTLFLVASNGFFVAAEFAIVKVRSSQIEIKAKSGSTAAAFARHINQNLNSYLGATQLGITISSLGLGWVAEAVMTEFVTNSFAYFGLESGAVLMRVIGFLLAFGIIMVLHIVLGELMPKAIAIQQPIRTTMSVAIPLRVFYIVFRPLILMLNGLSAALLRLIGYKVKPEGELQTTEDIHYLLDQGMESGVLNSSEHELIKKVFEFNERMVKNIMVPRNKIAGVDVESGMEDVLERITSEGYSRVPIYEDDIDQIIGVIHTKDILPILTKGAQVVIRDIMRKPYFIPETKMINELMAELQQQRIQMAIVLDEFGGTAGIVTLEDIMEELVGEIQDEYDEETPVVEKISATEYMVDASANVHDVNQFLPFDLPEGSDYDTISGLVGDLFDKIPEVGEHRVVSQYNLIIIKKSQQNIDFVKLDLLEEEQED